MLKRISKAIIVSVITFEARLVLRKYKPRIVTITGSVGKTSTKDAVATVLESTYTVRKSRKSFNSDIGVPLTILDLPNAWGNPLKWIINIAAGLLWIVQKRQYPEWLVLEIGADHPGDIAAVTKYLKPDIVVLTQYAKIPVHVEFFKSPHEVIDEKQHLPRSLTASGILITNGDDAIMEQTSMPTVKERVRYGFETRNNVVASRYRILYENEKLIGMHFSIKCANTNVTLSVKSVIGKQHVYPILAGFSVGLSLGVSGERMVQAFEKHRYPNGRMRILSGVKGSVIIDDSYNSSPIALSEALSVLGEVKAKGRKIAVLGDMMELGHYSVQAHRDAGIHAAHVADILITVGIRAQATAESARTHRMGKNSVYEFNDARLVGRELAETIEPGDVILVKGSQAVRMERVVSRILENPEEKEKLLVRQEKEWRRR